MWIMQGETPRGCNHQYIGVIVNTTGVPYTTCFNDLKKPYCVQGVGVFCNYNDGVLA